MDPKLLALIPAFPLLGAVINSVLRHRVARPVSGGIATAAVAASALLSFWTLATLLGQHEEVTPLAHTLYTWIKVGPLAADIGFYADPLSATMMCVITGIGSLIHLYSIGYMDDAADEKSVWRFFSYLNLFVFAMLLLVMGDNFLLMFVGWEGVGVCSYLLIGFWYQDTANAVAGKKAFVTNRVGDFLFILGLFLLFWHLGDAATLKFTELHHAVEAHKEALVGGGIITASALLFFGGATGKSAQVPLYVWLPDAMAGPTPVSALIHAATMVTAGIYMVCRLNFLFAPSPVASGVVAVIGALTAFLAATIAVSQNDIKKVLAYSTVSQLGYMFVGVGLGAYTAGFFHVLTHAFFKALMFLGSGSIIHALHHEQDMRKMGGLRKYMPITFWTFTMGWLAIIGFPGMSGFFSKDEILWLAFASGDDQLVPWVAVRRLVWLLGFFTALLTAFYMSRLYFMTFFGEYRGGHADHGHGHDDHGHGDHGHGHEPHESPWTITLPLVVLAILSVGGGLLNLPHWAADHGFLHHFLGSVFHGNELVVNGWETSSEIVLMVVTLTAIAGSVSVAWLLYGGWDAHGKDPLAVEGDKVWSTSLNKWYVDELYEAVLIKPITLVSRHGLWKVVDVQIIDGLVNAAASTAAGLARLYGRVGQSGRVQGTALAIAFGAAILVFIYATG